MSISTMTSEVQITLPEDVREHLHLTEGDRAEFQIDCKGKVELRPAASIQSIAGLLHQPGMRAISVEEMNEGIARSRAEDHMRILKGNEISSTVTADGQITLPEEVRDHLHLHAGDRVDFEIEPQGTVRLRSVNGSRSIFGLFHRPDLLPRTVEEMREGMIEFLAEENERVKRGEE